jgi:hypothetical protein
MDACVLIIVADEPCAWLAEWPSPLPSGPPGRLAAGAILPPQHGERRTSHAVHARSEDTPKPVGFSRVQRGEVPPWDAAPAQSDHAHGCLSAQAPGGHVARTPSTSSLRQYPRMTAAATVPAPRRPPSLPPSATRLQRVRGRQDDDTPVTGVTRVSCKACKL